MNIFKNLFYLPCPLITIRTNLLEAHLLPFSPNACHAIRLHSEIEQKISQTFHFSTRETPANRSLTGNPTKLHISEVINRQTDIHSSCLFRYVIDFVLHFQIVIDRQVFWQLCCIRVDTAFLGAVPVALEYLSLQHCARHLDEKWKQKGQEVRQEIRRHEHFNLKRTEEGQIWLCFTHLFPVTILMSDT